MLRKITYHIIGLSSSVGDVEKIQFRVVTLVDLRFEDTSVDPIYVLQNVALK